MEMKSLQTVGLFLLTVFAAGYAAVNQGSMPAAMLLGTVVVLVLVSRPVLLLTLLVCAGPSGVRVPGLFGLLSMQQALFVLFVLYGIIQGAISKTPKPRDLSDWGLTLFGLALALAMLVHGFGMRIAGSTSYGGKTYIFLFMAMFAYRAVRGISLDLRQARRIVVCIVLAAMIPAVCQLVIYVRPGLYGVLDSFVETSGFYLLGATANTTSEHARWQAMAGFATMVWVFGVALFALRRRFTLVVVLGLAVVMSLLSGFRAVAGGLIIMSMAVFLYTSRVRGMAFIGLLLAGGVGYAMLAIVGPHLPYTFQRSLSFVPLIHWDVVAVTDATDSWTWRLDVWKICASHLSENLLIGRGLLLEDVYQHAWLQAAYYNSPEFYYASHGYHNGPLALLLDTGILGLVGFLLFQVGMARNGIAYMKRIGSSADRFMHGYLLALVVTTVYGILAYYLLFGDIIQTLPQLVITGMMIRLVGDLLVREATVGTAPAVALSPHMAPVPGSLGLQRAGGAAS